MPIEKSTLFILGAGSAKEYGYPTGDGLIEDIKNNFSNYLNALKEQKSFNNTDKEIDQLIEEAAKFKEDLEKAKPISIDSYLTTMPKYRSIGVRLVCLSILHAEWRSCQNGIVKAFQSDSDDWMPLLFGKIREDFYHHDLSHLSKSNVQVLTFNYDRLLESHFHHYITHNFQETSNNDVDRLLKVRHVYGSIRSEITYSDFGKLAKYNEMVQTAEKLAIMYSDRKSITDIIPKYSEWINGFQQIFILGFGFDKFNLDKLALSRYMKNDRAQFFATLLTDKEHIKARIKRKFASENLKPGNKVTFEECNCSKLIEKHLLPQ